MVDMSFAYKSGGISRSRTSFYRIGFDTSRNKIKNGCKIRRFITSVQDLITARENLDKANQELAKSKQEAERAKQEFYDVLSNP
jgi:hypothetical protein